MLGCVASTIYTMGTQQVATASPADTQAKSQAGQLMLGDQVAASTGTGMTVKLGYAAASWAGGGSGWQAFGAGVGGYVGAVLGGAAGSFGGPVGGFLGGVAGAGAGSY